MKSYFSPRSRPLSAQREEHRELMKQGDDRLKGIRYLVLFNAEKLDDDRQEERNTLQKQQLRTSRD